jgi:uncharacterized repeat protein (TIGR01451 family)
MKKLFLLLFILFLHFIPSQAQYVTIPDANFVTKLTQLFPSCMNGNQMDTTCAAILNTTILYIESSNISDLTGIGYFKNLLEMNCGNNQLTSLPDLPDSLEYLSCSDNSQLISLPPFPPNLKYILVFGCAITNLPALPDSLELLFCQDNQISNLPVLPNALKVFSCGFNQLTNLPALPDSLEVLHCSNNQLVNLPALPGDIQELYCNNNQLIALPQIPVSLTKLKCSYNQLTTLPYIPGSMTEFVIRNNNITCLTNLPPSTNSQIQNNLFTCVPNQTGYSSAWPLCLDNDTINNLNNCGSSVNISGYVFIDQNNNCAYNANDLISANIPVKLYDSLNTLVGQSYTTGGTYGFMVNQAGTYYVKIQNSNIPIVMSCSQADSQSVNIIVPTNGVSNVNFPVICDTLSDFNIQSVNTNGWVFPGQNHTLNTNLTNSAIWYNLNCSSLSNAVNVIIEVTGPVTYISPGPNAIQPLVNGNTFTYYINDFSSLTPTSLGLKFMTDTTALATDEICAHISILPNPLDIDTTNNTYDFCYNVVNSYDPNMKEVYPVNVLPGYDDWFTYTIHFQNTGNAPAFNIRLRDTLDNNLDLSTFEMLGYSHPALVSINENVLTVRFNNIMLPDSTTDYQGSMGYFQYRIKPLSNLPLGTQIENTAYIYFDYNAPIVTNTTQNNFQVITGLNSKSNNQIDFLLYPNPSNGIFNFKDTKNIKQVEVYNLLGEQILAQGNQKQINLSGFAKGIYYARINGDVVVKLVKE